MENIILHMSKMDQHWNSPHGRPTLLHLINLQLLSMTTDNKKREPCNFSRLKTFMNKKWIFEMIQDIKNSPENVQWNVVLHRILNATQWNSATVTKQLQRIIPGKSKVFPWFLGWNKQGYLPYKMPNLYSVIRFN